MRGVSALTFLRRVALKGFGLSLVILASLSTQLLADDSSNDLAKPSAQTQSLAIASNIDSKKVGASTPDVLIQKATEDLVNSIKDARQEQKTIEFYYGLVEDKVSPFVDFKLIARRVMGRHYQSASTEDRERFVIAFRESLISTYAKGIAGYKDQSLVFLPFNGVKTKKGKTRAKVEMEIRTPSDAPVKVLYQMFLDKEQEWKLENIVLNGVNLGLTFRNQFSEAYKANAGDFSKVISRWGDS